MAHRGERAAPQPLFGQLREEALHAAGRRAVPVEDADVVEQRRVVVLDRHDVVPAAVNDQPGGVRAAVQRVEGRDAVGHADLAQQPAGAFDLAAGAVGGDLAAHHAAAVLDRGDEHAVRVGAAGTVERCRLAVDRERAAGGPSGGGEAPRRVVQGVGVEFRQHAVDAGPRRRHEPPGRRAAERPNRGQLALRQPGGELGDRRRPPRPRQLRGRGQRQHRRQRMPPAAPPAPLRHLARKVAQAVQPRVGRRPGRRRRLVQPAQRLPRAAQLPREHLLRPAVRHPLAVRPRVAPRPAQLRPVRRPVARPLETRRLHERLRQQRRMPQRRLLHVGRQPPQRQGQRPRRQVPRPRARQDQETRVVRHQPQTPRLSPSTSCFPCRLNDLALTSGWP